MRIMIKRKDHEMNSNSHESQWPRKNAKRSAAARRPYRLAPMCKGPRELPPGGRDAAPSASARCLD